MKTKQYQLKTVGAVLCRIAYLQSCKAAFPNEHHSPVIIFFFYKFKWFDRPNGIFLSIIIDISLCVCNFISSVLVTLHFSFNAEPLVSLEHHRNVLASSCLSLPILKKLPQKKICSQCCPLVNLFKNHAKQTWEVCMQWSLKQKDLFTNKGCENEA